MELYILRNYLFLQKLAKKKNRMEDRVFCKNINVSIQVQ